MNELIKVTETNGKKAVSARELHLFLENKKQFADWITHRINKYGLIENVDYQTLSLNGEKGRPSIEYALSLDAAKELSMVEGNAKGKQARQYFLECERKIISSKPQTTLEILEMTIKGLRENQIELAEIKADVNTRISQIESKVNNSSNYISIMGFARIKSVNIGLHEAAIIGTKAKKICKEKGYAIETVPDPRFGKVNIYPFDAVEEAYKQHKAA